jgi:uncharacterized membrane protein YgcG
MRSDACAQAWWLAWLRIARRSASVLALPMQQCTPLCGEACGSSNSSSSSSGDGDGDGSSGGSSAATIMGGPSQAARQLLLAQP